MDTETLISEFKKLPPDQKQVIKEAVLADGAVDEPAQDQRTLREVLLHSPFARMDFEPPEGVRSPVRPVEL